MVTKCFLANIIRPLVVPTCHRLKGKGTLLILKCSESESEGVHDLQGLYAEVSLMQRFSLF